MKMTVSRKTLNMAANVEYAFGAACLLLGLVFTAAGVTAMFNAELGKNLPVFFGEHTVMLADCVLGAGALFTFVHGFLEKRAVNNPAKVMPIWVIALIALSANAGLVLFRLMERAAFTGTLYTLLALIVTITFFVLANNVKKEVRWD